MGISDIKADIEYLAGMLSHRGSNTQGELAAAEYIRDRLNQRVPDASLDRFASNESLTMLLACFYAEFLIVALLAQWFPLVGFVYGLMVFLFYLAELTGFRTVSRLLPQYQTQNVVARLLGERPRATVVVTAHYDSGRLSPLTEEGAERWVRPAHLGLVICMVVVVAACGTQGLRAPEGEATLVELALRWGAAGCLGTVALLVLWVERNGEYSRGLNDNASGVAALIELAGRLREAPLEGCDVLLVATGSKKPGLNGMRHVLRGESFDRETAYFLNLDRVGVGEPAYVVGEGMLRLFRTSSRMMALAEAVAPEFGARPCVVRSWPTDALIPLARGYHALGITAVSPDEEDGGGVRSEVDYPHGLSVERIQEAARFVEAVMRRIAEAHEAGKSTTSV